MSWKVFDEFSPDVCMSTMQFGAEINALIFGVKGRGRDGILYAGNSTYQVEAYSTWVSS